MSPDPSPRTPNERAHGCASRDLLLRAAQTLELYAGEVEQLGVVLCSHETLVEHHLDELQAIDRLSQCLNQLSLVLRAPVPEEAVAKITIGALQEQLSGPEAFPAEKNHAA